MLRYLLNIHPSDRTELLQPATASRAGNGTRTRDPNLGKVVLYQLSYSREADDFSVPTGAAQRPANPGADQPKRGHGGEGDRTPDLVNAIHALSQLSYAPLLYCRALGRRGSTKT